MFKLCHSIEIITEHHYLKDQSSPLNRQRKVPKISHLNDRSIEFSQRHHRKDPSSISDRSLKSCPEENLKRDSRKGIEVTKKDRLYLKEKTNRKQVKKSSVNKKSMQILANTQSNGREVQYVNDDSVFTYEQQRSEPTAQDLITSKHTPHNLLRKVKKTYIPLNQQTVSPLQEDKSLQVLIQKLKPSEKTFLTPRKEINNDSQSWYSQKTRKRQQKYDCRNSQETSFSRTCELQQHIEGHHLKKACIFSSSPPQTTKLAIPKMPLQSQPFSSSHLYEAKSSISRNQSNAQLEDVVLQESILLKRETDMFQLLSPVYQVSNCQLVKAFDQRGKGEVTLKIFPDNSHQGYQQELQIIRRLETVLPIEPSLQVLKFTYVFIQDHALEKKIIFVFEPFSRILSQYLKETIRSRKEFQEYLQIFIFELSSLLRCLAFHGILLVCPLEMEDFLEVNQEWKLHNFSKFELGRYREDQNCINGWLQELRTSMLGSFL